MVMPSAGEFVMEYIGELISETEAQKVGNLELILVIMLRM